MKKVIEGAVYNTQSAKKLCELYSAGPNPRLGVQSEVLKQLYKTRSGKFFFYTVEKFLKEAATNDDDLDPVFEEMALLEERITPIPYDLAQRFVDEVHASDASMNMDMIRAHFPESLAQTEGNESKVQKKIYLSESANWYLQMLLNESEDTNSSLLERLIREEYKKQYQEGKMTRDPYLEMGSSTDK